MELTYIQNKQYITIHLSINNTKHGKSGIQVGYFHFVCKIHMIQILHVYMYKLYIQIHNSVFHTQRKFINPCDNYDSYLIASQMGKTSDLILSDLMKYTDIEQKLKSWTPFTWNSAREKQPWIQLNKTRCHVQAICFTHRLHWDVGVISKVWFSNIISAWSLTLKLLSGEYHRTSLVRSH